MFTHKLSFIHYTGFFASFLFALAASDIRADGETYWDTRFSTYGLNGKAKAIAISESNNVLVGGDFNVGGGVLLNHVGLWNGSSWSGFGSGVNGSVNAVPGSIVFAKPCFARRSLVLHSTMPITAFRSPARAGRT